jgi:hypothetical protein
VIVTMALFNVIVGQIGDSNNSFDHACFLGQPLGTISRRNDRTEDIYSVNLKLSKSLTLIRYVVFTLT